MLATKRSRIEKLKSQVVQNLSYNIINDLISIKIYLKRELLTRRLFTANEVFQTVLLHVRNLCERASNSRNGLGIDENSQIIMIKFDPTFTYTLDDFRSIQFEQVELALERLKALQNSIIDICYMACIVNSCFSFLYILNMLNT